ncbi:MAG: hypothetical protein CMI35_17455 [Owenweeksia sp.]|nr:hypothetical protein [Owenweeksia sp.]|tara:strand:- start:2727 stop:4472 length:1746 start_codon:yes stop_codon:yes gene_type:complete
MKNLFNLSICFSLLLFSCSKNEQQGSAPNPEHAQHLNELTIDQNFNWSSSSKGKLIVNLKPLQSLYTEDQPVLLTTEDGTVLQKKHSHGNQAEFFYAMPPNSEKLFIEYPNTGERIAVNGQTQLSFTVGDFKLGEKPSTNPGKKMAPSSRGKTTSNLLVNGDFEVNDIGIASYSQSAPPTGKWHTQADRVNYAHLATVSGSQVWQATNANQWGMIFQTAAITPSTPVTLDFQYRINQQASQWSSDDIYADFIWFDANGNWLGYVHMAGLSNTNPGLFSANDTRTAPANAAYVEVFILVQGTVWIDNVVLTGTAPSSDDDGDGIPNTSDDYPNDNTKAYASYYPTSGYQTLAFEDLWPAKGDFDFNDLVVSMDVEMAADTGNKLVDATFTISADAVGSGLGNGLAIVLRDANGNFLNQDVISNVSGEATADPDVTNGIIVFEDIYDAQESFYMNNGFGPSAPAEEFTFTVTFNANAGTQIIVPEMYIFRSGERGREIHQKGYSPTPVANPALFNTLDDVNGTYSTANGLPWVIELVTANKSFQHPLEKVDILQAYPTFQTWAESNGQSNTDWYLNPDNIRVF